MEGGREGRKATNVDEYTESLDECTQLELEKWAGL